MPGMEAEISEDGSVESDEGGNHPQAEESGENASAEDCVGNSDIVNNLFR